MPERAAALKDDPYTPNWQIQEKDEQCKEFEEQARSAAGYCTTVDGRRQPKKAGTVVSVTKNATKSGCVPLECENDSDCDECASRSTHRTLQNYFRPSPAASAGFATGTATAPDVRSRPAAGLRRRRQLRGGKGRRRQGNWRRLRVHLHSRSSLQPEHRLPAGELLPATETEKGIIGVAPSAARTAMNACPAKSASTASAVKHAKNPTIARRHTAATAAVAFTPATPATMTATARKTWAGARAAIASPTTAAVQTTTAAARTATPSAKAGVR